MCRALISAADQFVCAAAAATAASFTGTAESLRNAVGVCLRMASVQRGRQALMR